MIDENKRYVYDRILQLLRRSVTRSVHSKLESNLFLPVKCTLLFSLFFVPCSATGRRRWTLLTYSSPYTPESMMGRKTRKFNAGKSQTSALDFECCTVAAGPCRRL